MTLRPPPHSACAVLELPAQADWLAAVERERRRPLPWWLDAALPGAPLGRFSYAGADPWAVVQARHGVLELECRREVAEGLPPGRARLEGDPLERLAELLPAPPPRGSAPGLPFAGGAVGWVGYELASAWQPLRLRALDDLELPDLCFLLVDRLIAFDHLEGRLLAVGTGMAACPREARARARAAAESQARRVAGAAGVAPLAEPERRVAHPEPHALFDEASYAKAVRRAKRHIAAGDAYQVCLTHRLELPYDGDPGLLYRVLRARNPAPFGARIELPGLAVLSSSPERFLSVEEDGRVEIRPIKGTRPRGVDAAEDRALARSLADSAKDRAENLMIVDLVRNDLGRCCEIGSVEVPELMQIEAYASVLQMVSTVRGRLRPGRSALDALRAAFPPGSMTGAPKLAAMRILDRLEPVRRGVYSGCLGFLDLRGGAGLSVVIRTALQREGRVYVHTGGGIVADSDPAEEWQETWHKARPVLEAVARATALRPQAGPPRGDAGRPLRRQRPAPPPRC